MALETNMYIFRSWCWCGGQLDRLAAVHGRHQLAGGALHALTLETALALAFGVPRCVEAITLMVAKLKGMSLVSSNANGIRDETGTCRTSDTVTAITRHSELIAKILAGSSRQTVTRLARLRKLHSELRCDGSRHALVVTRCAPPSCSTRAGRQGRCRGLNGKEAAIRGGRR